MAQDPRRLPVLSLPDGVLLPGMVVPVELDSAAQAAVDAARRRRRGRASCWSRRGSTDRYAAVRRRRHDRPGRPASRRRAAAVLRAGGRARIGSGVPGPGAALWVEATPVERPG